MYVAGPSILLRIGIEMFYIHHFNPSLTDDLTFLDYEQGIICLLRLSKALLFPKS